MKQFISVILVVMMLCMCVSCVDVGDNGVTIQDATSADVVVTTVEDAPTTPIISVGQVATVKNLDISYVSYNPNVETKDYFSPEEGMKVISLALDFANNGTEDRFISFECFADQYEMDTYIWGDGNSLNMVTVSAGRKATGVIEFIVPMNANVIEVVMTVDMFNPTTVIFNCN